MQLAPDEGAVLEVAQWGRLLLYSTQRGGVHALDHRAGGDAWVLPTKARQVCTTLVLSKGQPLPSCGALAGSNTPQ